MFLEQVAAVWVEMKRRDMPRAGDDESIIANMPVYVSRCLAGAAGLGWEVFLRAATSLHRGPQSPVAICSSLTHRS